MKSLRRFSLVGSQPLSGATGKEGGDELDGNSGAAFDLEAQLQGLAPSGGALESLCSASLQSVGVGLSSPRATSDSGGVLTSDAINSPNTVDSPWTTTSGGGGNSMPWTRTRQGKATRTVDEVLASLPAEFFTPTHDPMRSLLMDISNVHSSNTQKVDTNDSNDITQEQTSGMECLTEVFMRKIEGADVDKDVIVSHLTTMIDRNYDDLLNAMSAVQTVNGELVTALMQVQASRAQINSASSILRDGELKIYRLNNKREVLYSLTDLVRALTAVKDLHRTMIHRLQTGDVGEAVELGKSVLDALQHSDFGRFHALKGIHGSTLRSLDEIQIKTDKALRRICARKFAVAEYSKVMRAFIGLDSLSEQRNIKTVKCVGEEDDEHDLSGDDDDDEEDDELQSAVASFHNEAKKSVLGDLVASINRSLLAEVDVVLDTAVLEQLYSVGIAIEDAIDLAEVPLHLLYRRLPSEHVPACIVRSCELLTEVIYTHYAISQWHSSPFGHSLPTQDTENTSVSEEVLSCLDNILSKEGLSHASVALRVELVEIPNALYRSRSLLWDQVVNSLSEILKMTTFTAEARVEELVKLLGAFNLLSKVGEEFCGADSSALQQLAHVKSAEFFTHYHVSSVQMLRLMVESELWQSIPVTMGEDESVLDIIKQSATRDLVSFSASLTASSTVSSSAEGETEFNTTRFGSEMSILGNWGNTQNPFRFIRKLNGEETNTSSTSQPSMISSGGDISTDPSNETFPSYLLSKSILGGVLDVFLLTSHDSVRRSKKRTKDAQSSVVVTQAVLNGVAKYCIKYLNLAALMPDSAGEICQTLFQLFDYYLLATFLTFTRPDERHRFLAKPTKSTAPHPHAFAESEALQAALERIINEYLLAANGSYGESDSGSDVVGDDPNATKDSTASGVASSTSTSSGGPLSGNFGSLASGPLGNTTSISTSGLGTMASAISASLSPTSQSAPADDLETLRNELLSTPAQVMFLSNADNFYALNERIVAAESCWFVAQLLTEVKPLFTQFLSPADLEKAQNYISEFSHVSGQLRTFLYKSACPMLLDSAAMTSLLLDCGWDSKKLREQHHEWVDCLVSQCGSVWKYMLQTDQFADSASLVREQLWLELCQCAFDIVLEGYSRVRKCSPEGRALMTMDVFALHEGLNAIHACRPPRGKHYVDAFLRCFYMNEDDVMGWVTENWQSYSYRVVHGLLQQTMGSMLNAMRLREAVSSIDGWYDLRDDEGPSRLAILSQRLKDTDTSTAFSSFANKFRRKE